MTTERLDQRIHTATYIEMVAAVMTGYIAYPWYVRQLIGTDHIAKLNGYTLSGFLTQLLHFFDRNDLTLTNDRYALAHFLDIAHDVRTHEDGLATPLLFQQKLVKCT